MTEAEYKFLEVLYNRGRVHEQSFINYLNGSLPESIENKKEFIDNLFIKFREFGFIDEKDSSGQYEITGLGKEKYEELSERKELHRKLETLSSRRMKVLHFNPKFWLALIIVTVIVSVVTSMILNKWQHISELIHKLIK